jgi:hypothetical protein
MGYFCRCPRCGERSLEKLATYAHCPQCLYSEDYWVNPDRDLLDAQKAVQEIDEAISKRSKQQESTVIVLPAQSKIETVGA